MSLCLQSIVDEILRIKQGKPVKRVSNFKFFSYNTQINSMYLYNFLCVN